MRYITIAMLATTLGACATAYQQQGLTGGYSSTQLDSNVFQVSFKGNGSTDSDRASDFALLRSAEVALEHGFQYFVIIDSKHDTRTRTITTPTTSTTRMNTTAYGSSYGYGTQRTYSANAYGTATTTTQGGQTFTISQPSETNTIVCFKDRPDGFAFNAQVLVTSLRDKYDLNTRQK